MKKLHLNAILMEILTALLLLVFFIPFGLILLNAAKDSSAIINDPLGLPSNVWLFFTNVKTIFTNSYMNYFSSFINSIVITSLSIACIGVFSGMAAWVLVRTKTKYSFGFL
jgi:raffinose/stachyose/melibiose transport system permease protein